MEKEFLRLCEENQLVGAVCLVVKDGVEDLKLTFGKRSIESNEPITLDTVFRIASISKVIIASGIMKLVEKGALDINTDISQYLGFKLRNPYHRDIPITLKMMMTQTSSITDGLDDYIPNYNMGYNGVNGKYFEASLEDLLLENGKYYIKETFDKEIPGTKFIYSNFNCGILACIIEKVTGKYYNDFIREQILLPLGLDASFDIKDIKSKNIASLYEVDHSSLELTRDYDLFMKKRYEKYPLGNNFRGPAGGLLISPNDLKVFMEMLMNGGKPIFKKETIALMLSKHWQGKANVYSYYRAKGLQVVLLDQYDGKLLKGHFGDAYGVRSFMLFNEERHIGIIYMTNGGFYKRFESGIDNVEEEIIKLFLKKYW